MTTLDELRDRLANKHMADKFPCNPVAAGSFQAGWDAALTALSERAEFDEKWAEEFISGACYGGLEYSLSGAIAKDMMKAMRAQFDRDRARVALAEERSWHAVEERTAVFERNVKLQEQVKQLEARLAESEREVARLTALDYSKEDQRRRDGLASAERENLKLSARLSETEYTLKVREARIMELEAEIAKLVDGIEGSVPPTRPRRF